MFVHEEDTMSSCLAFSTDIFDDNSGKVEKSHRLDLVIEAGGSHDNYCTLEEISKCSRQCCCSHSSKIN